MSLVEVMVAAAVMAVVLTAVASSFLTAARMMRTAMAESELALAAREVREKLLFRMTPTIGTTHYAGLLSGTNDTGQIVESTGVVQLKAEALGETLSDRRSQSMRLTLWSEPGADAATRYYLANDHTPDKEVHRRWLWPRAVSLADHDLGEIVSYDRVARAQPQAGVYRLKLAVNLQSDVRNLDGTPIVRRECVSVPVFGKQQPMTDAGGGY